MIFGEDRGKKEGYGGFGREGGKGRNNLWLSSDFGKKEKKKKNMRICEYA